jgi:hypothetical protein
MLGCPSTYEVFVTGRNANDILIEIPWSNLSWERVVDDCSGASVTSPDSVGGLYCCSEIGGVRPWRNGLRIERDSELVWCGPITLIERSVNESGVSWTINAEDKMAWMKKRLLRLPLLFTDGTDPAFAFRAIIEQATKLDNEFDLQCPFFTSGQRIFVEYLPTNFVYCFDLLQEIADAALDYTMFGPELLVAADLGVVMLQPIRSLGPVKPVGLVTDDWFSTLPGFSLNGFDQANVIFTPLPDSGEQGFRVWGYAADTTQGDGVLDEVNTSFGDNLLDQEWANIAAKTILDLRRDTPLTINGGVLSQDAPVLMSQLIPGGLWNLNLADDGCLGELTQVARLKRLSVSVTADNGSYEESVEPELIPLGTERLVQL